MSELQTHKRPGGVRIVDRCLLAEEVGKRDDATSTWPHAVSLHIQLREVGSIGDDPLEPANQAPARRHAAAHHVATGQKVEIEVETFVDEGFVYCEHDVTGTAELDKHVAVVEDPRRECRTDMVRRASHDGQADWEAGLSGCLFGDMTHDLLGSADGGQEVQPAARSGHDVLSP